jgi:hypothetical protein
MIEVNDNSASAKCDADQALITTLNGVDWSQTYVGKEPELKPLTLVDITAALIDHQAAKMGMGTNSALAENAKKQLNELSFSMQ